MNLYAFTIALGLLLLAVAGLLIRPVPTSVVVTYAAASVAFVVALLDATGLIHA